MMDSDDNSLGRINVTQFFSEDEVAFDYYSCEEAINRLNDYLDHELEAAERADVVKHLQICRPCLERFRFEETLLISIRTKVSAFVAPGALKDKLGHMIRSRR